jgi:formiminotetrahydrofolate cyclodeaminase
VEAGGGGRVAEIGMPASLSDAAVGAAMARASAPGAAMNVRINLQEMAEDDEAAGLLERADRAAQETREVADRVVSGIWSRLGGS